MRPDPLPRSDGTCHVCGKRRGRLPKDATRTKRAELAFMLAVDPFCSATCARVHHGTTIDGPHRVGLRLTGGATEDGLRTP